MGSKSEQECLGALKGHLLTTTNPGDVHDVHVSTGQDTQGGCLRYPRQPKGL